jgi:hypothetical protein
MVTDFAMFSNNHHNDGHVAVTLPAAIGIQEMLIKKSPKKFYRPPYVGVRGWIGIELERVSDKELALHIKEAWKLVAPEKLHQQLDSKARRPAVNSHGRKAVDAGQKHSERPAGPAVVLIASSSFRKRIG